MSDDYSRYAGMKTVDLNKYYKLSVIMRKYYYEEGGFTDDKKRDLFLTAGQIIILLLLMANSPWQVLVVVIPLICAILWIKLKGASDKDVFEDNFVAKAMDAGHSRSDAIVYLHDVDWVDITDGNARLFKMQQELNNAKNQ